MRATLQQGFSGNKRNLSVSVIRNTKIETADHRPLYGASDNVMVETQRWESSGSNPGVDDRDVNVSADTEQRSARL
jgi:hypothetical protein